MTQYVMMYRSPVGYTPTEDTTPRWHAWFAAIGDQLLDMGQPVVNRGSVGNVSTATTELGGFSIIEAGSLEEALTIARGCPHLSVEGGVEVGQLIPPSPPSTA